METLYNSSDLNKLSIGPTSRILVVMPHPDDEAIFLGGFLHQLSTNGITTRAITMTVGEKSTLRYGMKPDDNLSEVRQKELTKSFQILGITDFQIHQYPDGELEQNTIKIKQTIQKNISTFKPTHIVTLEPDGIYGHPDHVALSAFVTQVVKKPIQLLYVTVSPDYHLPKASWMAKKKNIQPIHPDYQLKLRPSNIFTKIRSMRAHHSQFVPPVTKLPFQSVFFFKNKLLTYEYFAKG